MVCLEPNLDTKGNNRTSEDCLTLNIHVPDFPQKESLPVLIYFHGGAFITGSNDRYYEQDCVENNGVIYGYFLVIWKIKYPENTKTARLLCENSEHNNCETELPFRAVRFLDFEKFSTW